MKLQELFDEMEVTIEETTPQTVLDVELSEELISGLEATGVDLTTLKVKAFKYDADNDIAVLVLG